MSLLSIDTFRRNDRETDSPWVAIVCQQGEKIENGRIGMGVTERAAVQSAINGYFAARQTDISAIRPSGPAISHGQRAPVGYVTERGIEIALETAISDRKHVILYYTDRANATTRRVVKPFRVELRRPGSGFREKYLIALDVEKDEPRTFKLSNIDRIEVH